jgi:phosphopantothenoylcysteine decarboxylase/phosphopantothenate--cysteine ligase
MHFLITAGGTREYIDPVRFISNASSGKMGFALAQAALKAGHRVTLITTITNQKFKIRNSKLKIVEVETAEQMFEAVKKHFSRCDCLIMAAAVADYTPIKKAKIKIKKSKMDLVIRLRPTVDILKWAGKHKHERRATSDEPRFVVGFALEDKNLRKSAEKKLKDKNLDMIIANSPAAVGSDSATVQIKTPAHKWLKLPYATKTKIAKEIVQIVEAI